jgi:hypothetical protein
MATTESRSGFRLPWAGDRRDDATDTEMTTDADGATQADGALEAVTEPSEASPAEAAADGGARTTEIPLEDAARATASAPTPSAPLPAAHAAAPAPASVGRKPTKFLADLTKAMQAAAEAERQETLELFQLEAKAHVESIHGRSATEAEDLRKHADEDIAAIRDWSKQEIARIREETENRISARKTDLTEEIDAHAARIEREIERVHTTVGRFEQEMATFFEELLGESDPTRFAGLAANLPEPPSFDSSPGERVDATAAGTALAEPEAPETEVTEVVDADEAVAEPMAEADAQPMAEAEAAAAADAEPAAEAEAEASAGKLSPADQEAAFAAIEESARAAENVAQPAEAEAEADGADTGEASEADQDDPRLAALKLADFDSAEAEASANLPSSDEAVPELADETVAARLAGLVPDDVVAEPAPEPAPVAAAETSVFVSGLISVASIAGFKRSLGRTPGIQSVGVTSGPDGEFVFAVAHDPSVDVAGVVTSLAGFGARVTESGDGVVRATAHDPDAA